MGDLFGGSQPAYVPPPVDTSQLVAQQEQAADQAADAAKNRLRASGGIAALNGPAGFVGATGQQSNQTLGNTA